MSEPRSTSRLLRILTAGVVQKWGSQSFWQTICAVSPALLPANVLTSLNSSAP